ncbi:hypothetical protein Scep_029738 [Stephania cephalantha]|uniref:Uncharacterized protein n=1 Tax=Stephania cephalantha TaxID=152367 RepID=A0AAP0E2T2_9MAGN
MSSEVLKPKDMKNDPPQELILPHQDEMSLDNQDSHQVPKANEIPSPKIMKLGKGKRGERWEKERDNSKRERSGGNSGETTSGGVRTDRRRARRTREARWLGQKRLASARSARRGGDGSSRGGPAVAGRAAAPTPAEHGKQRQTMAPALAAAACEADGDSARTSNDTQWRRRKKKEKEKRSAAALGNGAGGARNSCATRRNYFSGSAGGRVGEAAATPRVSGDGEAVAQPAVRDERRGAARGGALSDRSNIDEGCDSTKFDDEMKVMFISTSLVVIEMT